MQKNQYEILGLQATETVNGIKLYKHSLTVITKAYRNLARKNHPDINPSAQAKDRMAEINAAYEILSDNANRQAYDLSLENQQYLKLPKLSRKFVRDGVTLTVSCDNLVDARDFNFYAFFETFYLKALLENLIKFEYFTRGGRQYQKAILDPTLPDKLTQEFNQKLQVFLNNKAKKRLAVELKQEIDHLYNDYVDHLDIKEYNNGDKHQKEFSNRISYLLDNPRYALLDKNLDVWLQPYAFGNELIKMRLQSSPDIATKLFQNFGATPSFQKIFQSACTDAKDPSSEWLASYATHKGCDFNIQKYLELDAECRRFFPLVDLGIFDESQIQKWMPSQKRVMSELMASKLGWQDKETKLKLAKKLIDSPYFAWVNTYTKKDNLPTTTLQSDLQEIMIKQINESIDSIDMNQLHATSKLELEKFSKQSDIIKYQSFSDYFWAVIGVLLALPFVLLPLLSDRYRSTFFTSGKQVLAQDMVKNFQPESKTKLEPLRI